MFGRFSLIACLLIATVDSRLDKLLQAPPYNYEREEDHVFDKKWYCGPSYGRYSAYVRKAAQIYAKMFGGDCMGYINECCFDHDRCYDKLLGQQYCDAEFCGCLSRTTCRTVGNDFCQAVQDFGEYIYHNPRGTVDLWLAVAKYLKKFRVGREILAMLDWF
ncbi:unnamed protein product [Bursaphelenchus okinawaensis]|uniref:Phospholipase A2 n=1 Tax=Bursaphelenchus okinawaensis TaxID=465554 RepID=A0A811JQ48_9BILA|nr:unnamed protein product [Bursaphelenchus okinawaensis]CAG9077145.1 unnamed protein product [Bursaphelenchus okinawaensis]